MLLWHSCSPDIHLMLHNEDDANATAVPVTCFGSADLKCIMSSIISLPALLSHATGMRAWQMDAYTKHFACSLRF